MSEMVERVSRALAKRSAQQYRASPELTAKLVEDWEPWISHARAVIVAMREPTEAMFRAGRRTVTDQHPDITWPIMIDAALSEEPMIDAALAEEPK